MKKLLLLLSMLALLVGGCFEKQFSGTVESKPWISYREKEWNKLKTQAATAVSWNELPSPGYASEIGNMYSNIPCYNSDQDQKAKRRRNEVWHFVRMVSTKRREWYVAAQPELLAKTKEYILAGTVHRGMTKEQILAGKGNPTRINRSVGSWGIHEQWIYGRYINNRIYLYFENGILTSWQD